VYTFVEQQRIRWLSSLIKKTKNCKRFSKYNLKVDIADKNSVLKRVFLAKKNAKKIDFCRNLCFDINEAESFLKKFKGQSRIKLAKL